MQTQLEVNSTSIPSQKAKGGWMAFLVNKQERAQSGSRGHVETLGHACDWDA